MISVQAVTKRFGERVAVQHVSFDVPRGTVFGLLGHNGAGKSTIIGMVLGQIFPDNGRVLIDGVDVGADRRGALAAVGAMYETPAFYDYLSGEHNLRIFAECTGPLNRQRIDEVVRLVRLGDRIHDRVGTYSHGMRQRLALAQALLPQPAVLVLDEPMDGLDPEGIREIRSLVLQLNREYGMTILLCSHLLHEAEQTSSHVAVLRNGELLFTGAWREAVRDEPHLIVQVDQQTAAERGLLEDGLLAEIFADGRSRLAAGTDAADVAHWLVTHGHRIRRIAPAARTLEDFYLATVRELTP